MGVMRPSTSCSTTAVNVTEMMMTATVIAATVP